MGDLTPWQMLLQLPMAHARPVRIELATWCARRALDAAAARPVLNTTPRHLAGAALFAEARACMEGKSQQDPAVIRAGLFGWWSSRGEPDNDWGIQAAAWAAGAATWAGEAGGNPRAVRSAADHACDAIGCLRRDGAGWAAAYEEERAAQTAEATRQLQRALLSWAAELHPAGEAGAALLLLENPSLARLFDLLRAAAAEGGHLLSGPTRAA